ncbi:NAD(P)-binding domain-containing protein [Ruegeria atlantica]|uniref:NAD(P)-binding domain-containing protein n=1 Tax=Ruegeria atlantica TaxID=81569 RepID=UPI0014810560
MDAPVTGAVDGARTCNMPQFAGGDGATVARFRPAMELMGSFQGNSRVNSTNHGAVSATNNFVGRLICRSRAQSPTQERPSRLSFCPLQQMYESAGHLSCQRTVVS